MIQAFRFIEISKYDDGGQLMTTANLCLEAVVYKTKIFMYTDYIYKQMHNMKLNYLGVNS